MPSGFAPCPEVVFDVLVVLDAAGAPQIPASLFALAMLARLGPCEIGLLCTPALVPAADHRLAKASPPLLAVLVLAAGLPRFAMDVGVDVEDANEGWLEVGMDGRAANADGFD